MVKWHTNISSPVVSTASIYRDCIIVGTFSNWLNEPATDGKYNIVCAFDIHDATQMWKFELPSGVFSSICSVKDIHVFGCLTERFMPLGPKGISNGSLLAVAHICALQPLTGKNLRGFR